jgi:hypothetical protein
MAKRIEEFVARALAISEQDEEAGAVGYMARAMIQATMPHSKTDELHFTRKNGNYTLTMTATNPKVGLPFGALPRLILCWLTGEVVRKREPKIYLGDSLSEFMHGLGLAVTGGQHGSIARLKNHMHRLFTTAITCDYIDDKQTTGVNFFVADSYRLWWNPKTPEQISIWESEVTLSNSFYKEIVDAPVPIRLETLGLLKSSSLALDVYCWATYRNSYARRETAIPYEALQHQFGAGYPFTAQGQRNFKKKFFETLGKVALAYPEVSKFRAESNVLIFVPGRPDIPQKAVDK